MALHRHAILVFARDAPGGVTLGAEPHQARVKCAPETVFDDRVGKLGVAVAKPTSGARGKIRGIGHGFHASGDHDVGFAARHHLIGEVDGVQA